LKHYIILAIVPKKKHNITEIKSKKYYIYF